MKSIFNSNYSSFGVIARIRERGGSTVVEWFRATVIGTGGRQFESSSWQKKIYVQKIYSFKLTRIVWTEGDKDSWSNSAFRSWTKWKKKISI